MSFLISASVSMPSATRNVFVSFVVIDCIHEISYVSYGFSFRYLKYYPLRIYIELLYISFCESLPELGVMHYVRIHIEKKPSMDFLCSKLFKGLYSAQILPLLSESMG